MKSKFLTTCLFIMLVCSIIYFQFEDSFIAGIAFGVAFFTQAAYAIALLVDEE